ncbi:tyrosine-type recombinase/integrase [Kribbella sp. DT2]|uniref:tyrosine-type recombinase/integrase n=1 Tax=Kribbella sp. DT2 TaxID=3393427 RepID=UPI003CF62ED8
MSIRKTARSGASSTAGVRWRKLDDGSKVYEARWREPKELGGRLRSKSGFPTSKAAADHRTEQLENLRKGTYISPERQRTTWETVAEDWLASKIEAGCTPRTTQSSDRILIRWYSKWNNRPISSIKTADVEAILKALAKAGLATQTRHNVFNVASGVLGYAEDLEYIHANPARKARKRLPSREAALRTAKKKVRFLTAEEVGRLADAVYEMTMLAQAGRGFRADPQRAVEESLMVRFMAWSGLRRGEVAALQVKDLDPLRFTVRVERSAQWINREFIIGPPKSERGLRTVPLAPTLMTMLTAYVAARNLQPEDYLYGGATPRRLENFYRRRFVPACKRAKLGKVRIHDLRHTYASLMAHQGHKVAEVSEWMGHSKTSTTLDIYTHLFKDDEQHAQRAAALDLAFTGGNVVPLPTPKSDAV